MSRDARVTRMVMDAALRESELRAENRELRRRIATARMIATQVGHAYRNNSDNSDPKETARRTLVADWLQYIAGALAAPRRKRK